MELTMLKVKNVDGSIIRNLTINSVWSKFDQLKVFVQGKVNIYTLQQKMKFSIKNFFGKCDQICSFLRI